MTLRTTSASSSCSSAAVANAPASVARTQQVIAFAQRARWLIIVGCLIALAGALILARYRWRALALLGLGTLVATVATRLLVEHVVDRAPLVVDAPGGQAAIASITDGAIDPLRALLVAGSVIGAVLAALGVVATVLRDRRASTAGDGEHG
ncbi:MAG: hypothetical protein ACR2HQ_11790 [Ilumatobacteraceae bacterium]